MSKAERGKFMGKFQGMWQVNSVCPMLHKCTYSTTCSSSFRIFKAWKNPSFYSKYNNLKTSSKHRNKFKLQCSDIEAKFKLNSMKYP